MSKIKMSIKSGEARKLELLKKGKESLLYGFPVTRDELDGYMASQFDDPGEALLQKLQTIASLHDKYFITLEITRAWRVEQVATVVWPKVDANLSGYWELYFSVEIFVSDEQNANWYYFNLGDLPPRPEIFYYFGVNFKQLFYDRLLEFGSLVLGDSQDKVFTAVLNFDL